MREAFQNSWHRLKELLVVFLIFSLILWQFHSVIWKYCYKEYWSFSLTVGLLWLIYILFPVISYSYYHICGVFKEVKKYPSLEKKGIYRELENYVTMISPDYAFFLNGEWGSGKTHFIKHWQKIHLKEQYRESYYVSLYGITDFEKLSAALEDAVNTSLKNRFFQLFSLALRGLPFFKGSHSELAALFMQKPKDKTLIFDDLERCKIPLEELLGYLQRLIDEGQNYLILVANEAEIEKKLSKEENKEKDEFQTYQEAKAKTIGKELILEYDFDFLYENLVNGLQFPKRVPQKTQRSYRYFLKSSINVFSAVREVEGFSLKLNNFRDLKRFFLEFEKIYEFLEEYENKYKNIYREISHNLLRDTYFLYLRRTENTETPIYSDDYEDLRGSLILKYFKSENIEKEFRKYLKDLFEFKSGFKSYFNSILEEIHNEEYKSFLECNKEVIIKKIFQNNDLQQVTDIASYQGFKDRIIQWEQHYLKYFGGTERKYDLFACEILFNHPYHAQDDQFNPYFDDLTGKAIKSFRDGTQAFLSDNELLLYKNIIEYFYLSIIEARPSWLVLVFVMFTLASAMDEIAEEAGHKEKMKEAIKAHIKKQLFFNDKAGTYHPIYEKRIKEPNIYRSVADIEDPSELARDPAQYQYYLKYKEDYKELADYLDDYWNEHPEYKEKCVREYFGQYHEEYLKSKDKEEIDIKDEELSRIFENFYIISHNAQEKIIDILNNERERLLKYFLSPRTMQLSENLKKIRGALSTKKIFRKYGFL